MTAYMRRLMQLAIALAMASTVVLVTQWAYPVGSLSIHLGHPQYSRFVGESDVSVAIEMRVQNVGVDAVRVYRQQFVLVDDQGHSYQSDPATQFVAYHAAATTIRPLQELRATMIFRLPKGRTASQLLFVTTTGEIVPIKLS